MRQPAAAFSSDTACCARAAPARQTPPLRRSFETALANTRRDYGRDPCRPFLPWPSRPRLRPTGARHTLAPSACPMHAPRAEKVSFHAEMADLRVGRRLRDEEARRVPRKTLRRQQLPARRPRARASLRKTCRFSLKGGAGVDELAKDTEKMVVRESPRCTKECMERVNERVDGRQVTPDRDDQLRFSGYSRCKHPPEP